MSLQFKEKNVRMVLGRKINDNSIEDTVVWGETRATVFKNTNNVKCSHIVVSDNDSPSWQFAISHELDHLLHEQLTYVEK